MVIGISAVSGDVASLEYVENMISGCKDEQVSSTKKKGDAMGDFEGLMYPLARFSSINLFISLVSRRVRGYTLQSEGKKSSLSSIAWSQGQDLGKRFALSLSKMSKYSCNSGGTILRSVRVSSLLAFSF